jgi:hypothetical protein
MYLQCKLSFPNTRYGGKLLKWSLSPPSSYPSQCFVFFLYSNHPFADIWVFHILHNLGPHHLIPLGGYGCK